MKILLVPGSGAGGNLWHYQTRVLPEAEGVSLPGHPEGQPKNSIPEYVEWLHDYAHTKGYKEFSLGGHSLGGGIAQLYALTYPEDLKALILVGTGARLRVLPDTLSMLRTVVGSEPAWRKFIEATPQPQDPVLASIRETRYKIGPAVMLNDLLCCDKFDIMDKVQGIKLPTLIIVGTQDINTPVKYAQYLRNKIADSKLVIIEGATHNVMIEKPDEVNRAIVEFLKSINAQ
jgi:pimeloyl-ACP methyl ester carboxylesterase